MNTSLQENYNLNDYLSNSGLRHTARFARWFKNETASLILDAFRFDLKVSMTEGRTHVWCQKFKGPGFTAPYLDGLMPPQEEKQITSEDIVPPWNSPSLSLSVAHTNI